MSLSVGEHIIIIQIKFVWEVFLERVWDRFRSACIYLWLELSKNSSC